MKKGGTKKIHCLMKL